jgi:hypothetical protein
MSNENFRRQLNDAIDRISGSPSPALRDRVRSSLTSAPASTGPHWVMALAAVVIAVLLVGVLVVANPLSRGPKGGPATGSTPTASPSAAPASPTASPSSPTIVCGATQPLTSSSSAPAVAYIDAVRTGTHSGYDRLTIEFQNGSPASYEVKPQSSTTFTMSPSGQTVTVQGSSGILITIHGADLHTDYSGSLDIKTGYAGLVEVRRVQDFEGVVQLALGVSGTGCYQVLVFSNPDRLVIDIQTS